MFLDKEMDRDCNGFSGKDREKEIKWEIDYVSDSL